MNNKRRGSNFERTIVNKAKKLGLFAKRAYASNGEALGKVKEVDLMIEDKAIQAKKRKALPAYLKLDEGVDAVVFNTDRELPLVLVSLDWYLLTLSQRQIFMRESLMEFNAKTMAYENFLK